MSHVAAGSVTSPGLLWKWATDWRMGLTGLSNGILQLMHPGLGAGVIDHSDFFSDPWDRINRSLGPIVASIRDDDTAHAIKEMHRHITGVDANGDKYHALNPEIFWWAHATLYRAAEQAARRFSADGLTGAERESMYAEGVIWYQRYGVSDRSVPPTCRDYTDRFRQICTDTLEMTPAAERAVDMALHGRVEGMLQLPRWAATPIEIAVTPTARLSAIGGLPATIRRRFDIPWSISDDLQYRSLIMAARGGSLLMPEGLKHISMRRLAERSRIPAGTMGSAA